MATETAATEFPRAECESCHEPIIWTVTTNATAMPVDFEPVDGGNLRLEWRAGKVLSSVVKPALAFGRGDLRKAHFATCPQARSWRRRRSSS